MGQRPLKSDNVFFYSQVSTQFPLGVNCIEEGNKNVYGGQAFPGKPLCFFLWKSYNTSKQRRGVAPLFPL